MNQIHALFCWLSVACSHDTVLYQFLQWVGASRLLHLFAFTSHPCYCCAATCINPSDTCCYRHMLLQVSSFRWVYCWSQSCIPRLNTVNLLKQGTLYGLKGIDFNKCMVMHAETNCWILAVHLSMDCAIISLWLCSRKETNTGKLRFGTVRKDNYSTTMQH